MSLLNSWKDKLTSYVDVRLNLIKLSFIERTSTVLGFVILSFILLFLSMAVLLFIGIGMQEWFTAMLDGNRIGGAFLTALFYIVLIVVIILVKKPIVNMVGGVFVRVLTDPGDDDDDKHAPAPGRKIKVEGEDD
jgi:hypothetical protein